MVYCVSYEGFIGARNRDWKEGPSRWGGDGTYSLVEFLIKTVYDGNYRFNINLYPKPDKFFTSFALRHTVHDSPKLVKVCVKYI